jgi:hypothetical protein
MYLIPEETLREVISGLKAYGKSATESTVEKLEDLEVYWVEEEGNSIVDYDSV